MGKENKNSGLMVFFLVFVVLAFAFWLVNFLRVIKESTENVPQDDFSTDIMQPAPIENGSCVVTGCSNHLCVDSSVGDIITTCEFLDEYVCYKLTICERQEDGNCGWTENEEFAACMANPSDYIE